MTQLAPTTLLYGQALALLQELRQDFIDGKIETSQEIAEAIRSILTRYAQGAGSPLMVFEPVSLGEPPSSEKMNRYLKAMQNDINLLQNQVDLLKGSSIFLHNFIATEILKAQRQNARAQNKMKTLQLYSNATDINMIIFGDFFTNEEFIDWDLVPQEGRVSLTSPGTLSLGRETDYINVISDATVKILPTSNGFPGNNHDITDPKAAPVNPATGDKQYTFLAELNPHDNVAEILDGQPNTWFEYENHWVAPVDRTRAKNMNFTYVKEYQDGDVTKTQLVNWALAPDGNEAIPLRLDLEFDLGDAKSINNIAYTPYGLANDVNPPVKIQKVQVSPDATDWTTLTPQKVWIGTDVNLQAARVADEITIGTAVWSFEARPVRYIRISVEQPNSIPSNIGHLYYESSASGISQRVEGPNPPITEPSKYVTPGSMTQADLIQKTEYFVGKRWAIGVRDCSIEELQYKLESTLVSKPFKVNGIIDRVLLEADVFVPPTWDDEVDWVKFYVSPDDGITWVQIAPVGGLEEVRQVVAFNDPLPSEFREQGRVEYVHTEKVVTSLRVKAEMSRPGEFRASSPIIRWYKLKVRLR